MVAPANPAAISPQRYVQDKAAASGSSFYYAFLFLPGPRRAIASGLLDAIRIGPGARLLRIHPTAHASYRKVQRV